MHLVSNADLMAGAPRWAHAPTPHPVPSMARAIAIGLERTTVIVIEGRDGQRSAPGDVIRLRHVGVVRMLAGDGAVLARRRLVSSPGAADTVVAHLIDEVRAATAAAPHLVVGLVQDVGDSTWHALEQGLTRLRADGAIRGWCEAIDRGALRERLERTLCVIEPSAMAREERLDHWEACLDAWDDAIDGVARFLTAHRDTVEHPRVVDAQLAFLAEHRDRMRYASLRRAGLPLRTDPDYYSEPRLRVRR
jgi:hypothetical protein